ncbi:MAG: ROK family transcriptional regulator [Desulfopila sp.]
MPDTGLNQDNSKVHNRALVLKLIKQHPGITRADLAIQTGLSKPAITKIMNAYLDKGIIKEDKVGVSRNKGLIVADGFLYAVVVYLGRLSLTGALYDIGGKVMKREQLQGVTFFGNDDLAHNTIELIERIIRDCGIEKKRILAVALAAPGAVNSSTGTVYNRSVPALDTRVDVPFNWGKIDLVDIVQERLDLPVFLENNSNLSALAESWFGKGLGIRNFVQYSIGMGLGGGAILDGRLFSGHDGIALEIGHTSVDMHGELCFCGNRGCLETFASFKKIVERYDKTENISDNEGLVKRLTDIFTRAERHEEKAELILRDHARRLASGAVTLINMFSPEKLIISTNELDTAAIPIHIMARDIEQYVRRHAYPVIAERVKIEMSELGEDIHLHGAYALILEHLYSLIDNTIEGGL